MEEYIRSTFNKKEYADFTIKHDDTVFHVNSLILKSNPFFKTYLEGKFAKPELDLSAMGVEFSGSAELAIKQIYGYGISISENICLEELFDLVKVLELFQLPTWVKGVVFIKLCHNWQVMLREDILYANDVYLHFYSFQKTSWKYNGYDFNYSGKDLIELVWKFIQSNPSLFLKEMIDWEWISNTSIYSEMCIKYRRFEKLKTIKDIDNHVKKYIEEDPDAFEELEKYPIFHSLDIYKEMCVKLAKFDRLTDTKGLASLFKKYYKPENKLFSHRQWHIIAHNDSVEVIKSTRDIGNFSICILMEIATDGTIKERSDCVATEGAINEQKRGEIATEGAIKKRSDYIATEGGIKERSDCVATEGTIKKRSDYMATGGAIKENKQLRLSVYEYIGRISSTKEDRVAMYDISVHVKKGDTLYFQEKSHKVKNIFWCGEEVEETYYGGGYELILDIPIDNINMYQRLYRYV